MTAHTVIRPESFEERVIWHCIVWTYAYYVVGALYVLAPVVGWALVARMARKDGLAEVPTAVWAWCAGMLLMLLALLMAHADFDMGVGPTVKSSIGWAKGWALIAVFIVIGCGQVRLELLARAACLLGIQSLCIFPFVMAAWAVGAPGHLYVSPVSIVGGPGPEYFAVELYGISPDSGLPRWRLFAPWAPAIGMVMCVYVLLALNERDATLRRLGIAGMVLAVILSSSRLGLLVLPIMGGVTWLLQRINQPSTYLGAAPMALIGAILLDPIRDAVEQATSRFHGARADSSRVRATLGRIAVERWQTDAFLWGHGNVERGPHLVEYMPIGSHHTWYGLLFVKGIVGAFALAVPMMWSLLSLLRSGMKTGTTRTGLRILVLLFIYTFAENLEILAYLYWPGLVALGVALREAAKDVSKPESSAVPTPDLPVESIRP